MMSTLLMEARELSDAGSSCALGGRRPPSFGRLVWHIRSDMAFSVTPAVAHKLMKIASVRGPVPARNISSPTPAAFVSVVAYHFSRAVECCDRCRRAATAYERGIYDCRRSALFGRA